MNTKIEYRFQIAGKDVWVKYKKLPVGYSVRTFMEGYGHVAGRWVYNEPTEQKAFSDAFRALLFRGMTS